MTYIVFVFVFVFFFFLSNLSEHFRLKYLEWGSFKNNSSKRIPKETEMVSSRKMSELAVGHWQNLLLHVCCPALKSDTWVVGAACVCQSAHDEACTHRILGGLGQHCCPVFC